MKAFLATILASSAVSCAPGVVEVCDAHSHGLTGHEDCGSSYGAGSYGVSSYGAGYGAGSYGVGSYGAGYGSYGAGYGSYGAGYAAPSRGYGYQPTVVKKEFGAWSKAYRLDVETYQKTVIEDTENVWVVAFVDDKCGGCVKLAVEWERLQTVRTITERRVRFAYVDTERASSRTIIDNYCGGHQIQYTPTVLVYGRNKYAPQEYTGDYSVNSLNSYICDLCDRDGYGIIGGYGGYGAGYGAGYGGAYGADVGYSRGGVVDSVEVGQTVSQRRVGGSYVTPAYGSGYGGYGNGYGSGYGGYGGYGSGYGGQRVIGAYGSTRNSRVVDVDYDRQTRAGYSQGGYARSTVQPGYGYGYDAPSYGYSDYGYDAPSYGYSDYGYGYDSPSYGGYSGW